MFSVFSRLFLTLTNFFSLGVNSRFVFGSNGCLAVCSGEFQLVGSRSNVGLTSILYPPKTMAYKTHFLSVQVSSLSAGLSFEELIAAATLVGSCSHDLAGHPKIRRLLDYGHPIGGAKHYLVDPRYFNPNELLAIVEELRYIRKIDFKDDELCQSQVDGFIAACNACITLNTAMIIALNDQTDLVQIEEEKHIFNHILSGHKEMFAIAVRKGRTWPTFLKFTNENVVLYSNKNAGWCFEVPGFPTETLQFIAVVNLNSEKVELEFQGQTKTITFDSDETGLYHGR